MILQHLNVKGKRMGWAQMVLAYGGEMWRGEKGHEGNSGRKSDENRTLEHLSE